MNKREKRLSLRAGSPNWTPPHHRDLDLPAALQQTGDLKIAQAALALLFDSFAA